MPNVNVLPSGASPAIEGPTAGNRPPDPAALALEVQSAVLAQHAFRSASAVFVTELARKLGCERVALGMLLRSQVEVKAVSHASEPEFVGSVFRDLGDAMEEAVDQGCELQFPEPPGAPPRIVLAQQRLRTRFGGTVRCIPIRVRGACVGAVSFEWSGRRHEDSPASAALAPLVDLVGPVLWLQHRAERSWRQRLAERLTALPAALRGRRRWLLPACAIVLAAVGALPLERHVSAAARLEGSVERAVVSPLDGYIEAVRVRPGDPVRAGQVVIELASQDLALEVERWTSELAQHESAYMAALAGADRSEMMVRMARAEEARARLDLARRNKERSRIAAGIDGVVIAGDVSRLTGAPVSRGDVLLTVAPANDFRVVLEVGEDDIGQVEAGQRGVMVLGAEPDRRRAVQVRRITPMASVIEGRNVYRVEAELEAPAAGLRPGLKGIAKIATGREPILSSAWQWLSRRLVMLWWRWGG